MCAKKLVTANRCEDVSEDKTSSPVPGNTIEAGYHSWRVIPRGSARSPVRNDAGRNALSGVKVSSPVKHPVTEWPSLYEYAKATLVGQSTSTLGVQVHGMYRRLFQELGRSPSAFSLTRTIFAQDVMLKCKDTQGREVRWFRSSEEVE